ncbi:MAG TPA: class I SAM-dependent methyltransferase [Aliidongia sp.]|uniref:class I SAM-dependent methyltransferase n=1 Tax=Aliidongia sp. TaxID=1914230 RepID=UPI002DDCAB0B|nr:class I SAM-dependent methyltransferase [Aliidongia sp.]HEV2673902.1 class I SAM-dependent methyltransferase [Aliidongia sp.]
MPKTADRSFSTLVKQAPLIGPLARRLARTPLVEHLRKRLGFHGSADYWDARYRAGGTSGAGSYGRLAAFKAEVLNEFVRSRGITSIVEFGCGDGAQLALADYPSYVGVDVAPAAVALCTERFAADPSKRFYLAGTLPGELAPFDLVLSLDVIYHLVENAVFDTYMRGLFDHARSHVAIYASDLDVPGPSPHVRHRAFTRWVAAERPDWHLAGIVPNRYPFDAADPDETSFADFHFFERRA